MGADPEPSLVAELHVRDFRTMRELEVELGPVCALVGEPRTGKSNLLAALRAVLDPASGTPVPGDVRHGAEDLAVHARLSGGRWVELAGRPPEVAHRRGDGLPEVVHLPAAERTREIVATFEALHRRRLRGAVVLVEEPELFLLPQEQRYLSRLLRRLAPAGNQVVFSTRSPAFLNVARMEEIVFVERREPNGTRALRPPPLTPDEDFRILSEFDAERAELFLARAVLLVEGATEKLALPFVFAALGEDADREGITIVECGGKANMVLFARVCRAAGVPFVALHDRDAPPGRRPSAAHRVLHERIAEIAGPGHVIEMAPDFEAIAHLRGGGHKPERAWRRFAELPADRMPGELVRAARLALALTRRSGVV